MEEQNIYKTPEADVENLHSATLVNLSFGKRFLITFLWGLPIYIFFVVFYTPSETWFYGFIGSIVFSSGSGIIAILIPSKYKTVFVSIGVFSGLVVAYIVGTSVGT